MFSARSALSGAFGLAFTFVGLPALAQTAPAAPAPIDVKLFAKKDIDRSKGCSVGIWQAKKNPDTDEFAYAFIEQLYGRNNARQTARIRIAGQDVIIRRVATGGKNNGFNLFEYQLYKMPDEDEFVVMELKLSELEGESIGIESGTMSFIMKGRPVFRMSVEGGAGCWGEPLPMPAPARAATAPAAAPAPARPAAAPAVAAAPAATADDHKGIFQRGKVDKQLVARELKQSAKKQFGCEDRMMNGEVIGFDMTEESAIWEIPCQSFAYQASSVFALVYTPAPGKEHKFLTFEGPKGHKRTNEPGVLLNAKWDVRARTVQSISLGRSMGDCGVLERYRVTAEGGFRLLEYREKKECDGKVVKPEEFPLVFRAR
ncbi:MAG: DUF1176 domain-containing protein [Bosea sp. (in: a-proteobacteria)]